MPPDPTADTGHGSERRPTPGTAVWLVPLAVVCSVVGAMYVVRAMLDPASVVADDSLFYPEIARNVAEGRGSTFSGLMPTNGYHPAWMGILVAANQVLPQDLSPRATLHLVVVLWAAILLIGLAVLARVLQRAYGLDGWAVVVALLPTLLGVIAVNTWGSEASVNLLALALAAGALSKYLRRPSTSTAALLGLGLGLCILARLDNIVVAIAVPVVALLRAEPGQRRLVALLGAIAALSVAPWWAWSYIQFGRVTTIATEIKTELAEPQLRLGALPAYGWAVVAGLAAVALLWLLDTRRCERPDPRQDLVVAFLLAAGVHTVGILVFAVGTLAHWSWYLVLELVATTIVAGRLLAEGAVGARLAEGRRTGPALGITISVVILVAAGLSLSGRSSAAEEARNLHGFGEELGRVTDGRGVVFVLDLPGVVAFNSPAPVVAFDGLTGDFEYQEALARRGVECTMADLGVEIVVAPPYLGWSQDVGAPGYTRAEVPLARFLDGAPVGSVTVAESDELLRSADGELVAWRVQPLCPRSRRWTELGL